MESSPKLDYRRLVGILLPDVYQFRIAVSGIHPLIWRRIQVTRTCGFFAFHSAILDVMGWKVFRPYCFQKFSRRPDVTCIKPPLEGTVRAYEDDPLIRQYFLREEDTALCVYDGKCQLCIVLETTTQSVDGVSYPACIGGARACLPDGISGLEEYDAHLEMAKDPNHPMHGLYMAWLATIGYTDCFSPHTIVFMDPKERFRLVYGIPPLMFSSK